MQGVLPAQPFLVTEPKHSSPRSCAWKTHSRVSMGMVIPPWTCVEPRRRELGTMNPEHYCGLPTNVWNWMTLSHIPITISSTQSRRDVVWQHLTTTLWSSGAVRPNGQFLKLDLAQQLLGFTYQLPVQFANNMQISLVGNIRKPPISGMDNSSGSQLGYKNILILPKLIVKFPLSLAGEMDAVAHPHLKKYLNSRIDKYLETNQQQTHKCPLFAISLNLGEITWWTQFATIGHQLWWDCFLTVFLKHRRKCRANLGEKCWNLAKQEQVGGMPRQLLVPNLPFTMTTQYHGVASAPRGCMGPQSFTLVITMMVNNR